MQTQKRETVLFSGLEAQYRSIKEEVDNAISSVLAKQHFILGDNVSALEEELARYCGVAYGVGVASGTDALILALKAAGVGAGDEVIVPAFTFVATADSVSLLGATPVFVDIDDHTWTMCPESLAASLSNATKAVIPVHLYGQCADMTAILGLAQRHNLVVIGDTAQALGASYGGAPVASWGDLGCLSFFPSKNLGCYGDGGMVVTNDQDYADTLKMLRSHGSKKKYHHQVQGWNSRLDELQAAILRAKLPHLDDWNLLRAEKAALYTKELSGVEGVRIPEIMKGSTHVFHQYTIEVDRRAELQTELTQASIQTAVHYPVPLHLQPMYQHLGYKRGHLPKAERAAERVLSLPIYPELSTQRIHYVCTVLKQALERVSQPVNR